MYRPYLDHEYSYDFVFFWPLNKRNAGSDLFRPLNIINDYRILVILYFSTLLAYTRSLCTAYVFKLYRKLPTEPGVDKEKNCSL